MYIAKDIIGFAFAAWALGFLFVFSSVAMQGYQGSMIENAYRAQILGAINLFDRR